MREKLKNLYLSKQELAHYLVMAVVIVSIEYVSYVGMVWAGVNYLLAVPISMAIGIVLNWQGSRLFVFKNRRHSPRKEFTLVAIASLVGVLFQLTVTFVVVDVLRQLPAVGKALAIVVTFFWNYWVRKKYIF
jgi:putative flippase GtrA